MTALILTASAGLLCMIAEIFRLGKWLFPLAVICLTAIACYTATEWGIEESYYNNMFRSDAFSTAFSILFIILTVFIIVMARDQLDKEKAHWADYISIIIFTLCGAIILTGFMNLAMLFLGIEILSISLYILAGSRRTNGKSNEAGMKYFLMGSFASGFLLFGIALLYGAFGSFDLDVISQNAAAAYETRPSFVVAGIALILVGMFFKVSAAPFHFWSPDVYQGSPSIITLFMATVAKLAAMAALLRFVTIATDSIDGSMQTLISIVTVLTLFIGNILATAQKNFKRVLAYSGISHAGFLLIGVLCAGQNSAGEVFYYCLSYGASNVIAFGVSMAVFKSTGSENIDAFNGLVRKRPFLAAALTISMLSLASIPPLSGFWAKYFMFSLAIREGYLWITIIGIINTLIGVYYYFRVIVAMLLGEKNNTPIVVRTPYLVIIFLACAIVIGAGIIPGMIAGLL